MRISVYAGIAALAAVIAACTAADAPNAPNTPPTSNGQTADRLGSQDNTPVAPAPPPGNTPVAPAPPPGNTPVAPGNPPGNTPVGGGPGGGPTPRPSGGPTPVPSPSGGPTPGPSPSGGPTPLPSPSTSPVVLSIAGVASTNVYRVVPGGMVDGAIPYTDESRYFIDVVTGPEFGREILQTALADAGRTDANFLRISLSERAAVIVLMAGDDPIPAWFANECPSGAPPVGCWYNTGRMWNMKDTLNSGFVDQMIHRLQVFPAGTIVLGGRGGTSTVAPQMYFVTAVACSRVAGVCP